MLVVEKEQEVGGYLGPLWHGGYPFNNGPRLLMGCNANGPYGPGVLHTFLEQIGARRHVDFIPQQPILDVRFPDSRFSIFTGREEFIAACSRQPRAVWNAFRSCSTIAETCINRADLSRKANVHGPPGGHCAQCRG